MTSELKAATARANGARSKGPKTAQTREISSQNALTHGLTSRKTILLECEDAVQFEEMHAEFYKMYQPANAIERDLVDELFSTRWRGERLDAIVCCLLDMGVRRLDPQSLPPSDDPAQPLATAFKNLADESKALSLALRYQTRLRRTHERALATLLELQRERAQAGRAGEFDSDQVRSSAPSDGAGGLQAVPESSGQPAARSSYRPAAAQGRHAATRKFIFPFEPTARYGFRKPGGLARVETAR